MNDKRTTGRGGKRPGAGRPPRYGERMVKKSVRLPPDWIEVLVAEFGSFQAAIEILAARHLEVPLADDEPED